MISPLPQSGSSLLGVRQQVPSAAGHAAGGWRAHHLSPACWIGLVVASRPSCSSHPRTHSLPAHRGGVGGGVGNAVSTTVTCNAREVCTSEWLPAARESRPRFVAMFSGCIDESSSSCGRGVAARRR